MDDLRLLRSFVVVAEEGSISRAAARLHMSQPPLSVRLRNLERELGVQLLVRHGRGVDTTAAGRVLAERCRRILGDLDAVRHEVEAIGQGARGRLRVAAGPGVVPPQLSRLISAVRVDTPEVEVDLVDADDRRALDALRHGEVDVAVVPRAPVGAPAARDTESAVVAREPLVAVLTRSSRPASPERVDLSAHAGTTLVAFGPDRSPALHDHVVRAWRDAVGHDPVVHRVDSVTGLLGTVLAGVGIALLPAGFDRVLWTGLEARPLRHHTPVVETAVFWRRDDDGPIVRRFLRTALATPEPDVLEPHHARTEPWVEPDLAD
jgi:DNA-binding transcriptional LysR family regulator